MKPKYYFFLGFSLFVSSCAQQDVKVPKKDTVSLTEKDKFSEPMDREPFNYSALDQRLLIKQLEKELQKADQIEEDSIKNWNATTLKQSPLESEERIYNLKIKGAKIEDIIPLLEANTGLGFVLYSGVQGEIKFLNVREGSIIHLLDAVFRPLNLKYRILGKTVHVMPKSYPEEKIFITKHFSVDYLSINRKSQNSTVTKSSDTGEGQSSIVSDHLNNWWGSLEIQLNKLVSGSNINLPNENTELVGVTNNISNSVVVHPSSGIIIVHTTPEKMKTIETYLEAVKKSALRSVTIDLQIFELRHQDETSFGVNWERLADQLSPALAQTTITDSERVLELTIDSKKTKALIGALGKEDGFKVISNPSVTALNEQTSFLKIGQEQPFFALKTDNLTEGRTSESVDTTETTTGLTIQLTPKISSEGFVILDLTLRQTEFLEEVKFETDGRILANGIREDIRETSSMQILKNGQSLVIGGLMRNRESRRLSGIPWLMDIPYLGAIFRRTEISDEKSELVFILTPTIHTHHTNQESISYKMRIEKLYPSLLKAMTTLREEEMKKEELEKEKEKLEVEKNHSELGESND